MTHKDICIKFEATRRGETRRFEAVGFLKDGEPSVDGDEMLRRVPNAIGEEDSNFLDECASQDWSRELLPYYLATNRRYPGYQRHVRYFRQISDRWVRGWHGLDIQWYRGALVLRRCA